MRALHLRTVLSVAAQNVELHRDLLGLCHVQDQVSQLQVWHHRGVVEEDGRAFPQPLLGLVLGHAREVPGHARLYVDANVRTNVVAAGLSAPQSHLLLNCRYGVDRAWRRVSLQELHHPDHSRQANAVVPSLGQIELASAEGREAAVR